MAILIEQSTPPKGRNWKIVVDARKHEETLDDILRWAKASCKGRVYWTKVRYHDHRSPSFAPSMKRNFKDGYQMLTVWFHRKGDAALFKLWWG